MRCSRRRSRAVNATLPPAQRISRFLLLYKELDADDGEARPAPERCAAASSTRNTTGIINAIYRGEADIPVDTVIRFQDGTTCSASRTTLRVVDLGAPALRPGPWRPSEPGTSLGGPGGSFPPGA